MFPLPMPTSANVELLATDARAPAVARAHFPVTTGALERVAHAVLDAARAGGATAAETEVSQAIGQTVTVRKG